MATLNDIFFVIGIVLGVPAVLSFWLVILDKVTNYLDRKEQD